MLKRLTLLAGISCILSLGVIAPAQAISPTDVLVVYNANSSIVSASQGVALYYAQARAIPQANLIGLQTATTENVDSASYVNTIATPIWNVLSQHPEIKVIAMCYGVPSKISIPVDPYGYSIDSALTLLGNPNVLNVTHWGLNLPNPYYNSSQDWETFRDSAANTISRGSGQQPWKMDYLVCRLDGYSVPTTTVTIGSQSYSIPSDVKNMIDRAVQADSDGRNALTNAKFILDDPWKGSPSFSSSFVNCLKGIVGDSNVIYDTSDTYLTNQQNVIGYAGGGSYHYVWYWPVCVSAHDYTTWWRPFNTWKPGAIGLFHKVSGDAGTLRCPGYIWSIQTDSSNAESAKLKVYLWSLNAADIGSSTQYATHWIGIHRSDNNALLTYSDSSPVRASLSLTESITTSVFGSADTRTIRVAEIDLNNINWPGSGINTYAALHFPDNDPYHPSEVISNTSPSSTIQNSVTSGITYGFGTGQSLCTDLIREGCSAVAGNVAEPGAAACPVPEIVLPQYATGRAWAESIYMGLPYLAWQEVAVGDPLMAPYSVHPTVAFASPTPANGNHVRGSVSLCATATPSGDGTIQRVEFWISSGQSSSRIGTDYQAPYECVWDSEALSEGNRIYSDDDYSIEVVAYQSGNLVGSSTVSRSVTLDTTGLLAVSISQPQTEDSVVSVSTPVVAQPGSTPSSVEFWLFGNGNPILAGTATTSPYQCSISSTVAANGVYQLQAIAYYGSPNSTSYSSCRRIILVNDVSAFTSVASLGNQSDNTQLVLANVPVVAGTSSTMNGALYVEDTSRVAGIRIETTASVATGKNVTISGTLHKSGTGVTERYIQASQIWDMGICTPPATLGMTNKLLGGAAPTGTPGITGGVGLYNLGLLVTTWGKVTYVGSDFVYIDDGSGLQDGNTILGPVVVPLDGGAFRDGNGNLIHQPVTGVKVYLDSLLKPGIDDYVSVTGISSSATVGTNTVRLLRVRDNSDIAYSIHSIPARRVAGGLVGPDNSYLQVGTLVRKPNDVVSYVYSNYLIVTDMSWQLHYAYAVSPAQTLLQTDDAITIIGTYSVYSGIWGFPEILPTRIYFGGGTYGAMSVSPGGTTGAMCLSATAFENVTETPERGGGPFKPWPYPTAEEILSSPAFQAAYNQPGNIGWVLSQPDGSVIDLRTEAICGDWYDGRVIGLREWFEPIPNGPSLLLYLDAPIKLDGIFKDMATIDIIGGTLVTLSDGRRAIMKSEAVYVYTDSEGRWTPPLPWPKATGMNGVSDGSDNWPWKTKVAP
ncbi:MAG: TIGR03790 family protein [Armatimonadota bacterium]